MNVVIIYDQCDLAVKACALLLDAAGPGETAVTWQVNPWQMDRLLSASSAELALHDAAEAHLLLLVLRRKTALSRRLLDWLERWAGCRIIDSATLAVWGGGGEAAAGPQLAKFADRHELGMISGDRHPLKIGLPLSEHTPQEHSRKLLPV